MDAGPCGVFEGQQEAGAGGGDFMDSLFESSFIQLRWLLKTRDLADELQSSGFQFFGRRGLAGFSQKLDAAAHEMSFARLRARRMDAVTKGRGQTRSLPPVDGGH